VIDVLIAGAGPAGCVAAIVLARAGARVTLLDRAMFPRDKLCGDTLNPGAVAILRRLDLSVTDGALPIDGMLVTGPGGVSVRARYARGISGCALLRRDLDAALLQCAAASGVTVEQPVVAERTVAGDRAAVRGLVVRRRGGRSCELRARLVIAADGRASGLARALSLSSHPPRPRRWAVGAYFSDVAGTGSCGEMHVRPRYYFGVAPLPDGAVNACVVTSDRERLRDARRFLVQTLQTDGAVRDRFASARMIARAVALGPLAVDCRVPGVPGLLLAGDAAGFIDPMTGDGLRFALRGAELAAIEAIRALETGNADAHLRLADARHREFSGKWRFNRTLRRLVSSPSAVAFANLATSLSSWPLTRVVSYAGDLPAA